MAPRTDTLASQKLNKEKEKVGEKYFLFPFGYLCNPITPQYKRNTSKNLARESHIIRFIFYRIQQCETTI